MTREMILAQCQEYLRLRAWTEFYSKKYKEGGWNMEMHKDSMQRYLRSANQLLKEIVEKCNFSSEAMALQFINLEIQEGNLEND